ncbi:NAD(P)-dependent oxidoreductase [Stenotrophomonas terrae]|uniref:NAD-dependent epimerase/dehydratase family protein n=1 Tax=Stenotrophomonas terrae TaxID=405446 RepID=UPI0032098173
MTSVATLSPRSVEAIRAFARLPAATALGPRLQGHHLLLTGGTGFFGQWLLALLDSLVLQGVDLRVTVVSRNPARFLDALPYYRSCSWLHWIASDVRAIPKWQGPAPDLILHAAAETSVSAHARPLELFDSILTGGRRLLDLAVECGAPRILFTGSGAQYGPIAAGQPVQESTSSAGDSTLAGNIYGEAKRAQETMAAVYAEQLGIVPVFTRCFAFAGPGLPLDAHFAIGNFVRDALHSKSIDLHSSGEAMRSYLHGADLACWLLHLLCTGMAGQAYNVGSDVGISIADLAVRVRDILSPNKPVHILGKSGGPRSYYVPDISKARSLGLDVWTSLEQSVEDMASFARTSNKQ